jgi:cell division protein ZapE
MNDAEPPAPAPRERYRLDLQRPDFASDSAQARAVEALQGVYEELISKPPQRRFGRSRLIWPPVRGLYLWGGVGRGKTYLMDTFCDALPFTRKRRTHFHRFMLEVHERRKHYPNERDPLLRVADEIAETTRVLCFDEFFVADIADAMILGRLFEALFIKGLTLVATSNVAPDDLYKDGLQRDRFLPAIAQLKKHVSVLNVDGGIDYRLRALRGVELYLSPANAAADVRLAADFDRLASHHSQADVDLSINDRIIHARRISDSVAWFDFGELCEGPRSAADYIELARLYHTVVLTQVPQLRPDSEDAARRFINLIDEFYDRGVKLLMSAEVPLAQLYAGKRLVFEFERTRSRLTEMQSQEYLARPHKA